MIRQSLLAAALLGTVPPLTAQVRGLYPLGMSAVGAGTLFAPGATYANAFLFYARDEMRGPDGEVVQTGSQTVLMDLNTIAWASRKPMLLGARLGAAAILPFANNSLATDVPLGGGGGFADSFYQPFMLGWKLPRADIKAAYGFLAPTGAFEAGATDNVGSGYWTHVVLSGQTIWPTTSRRLVLSIFEIYEFHAVQEGTGLRPGQTLSMDYSLAGVLPLADDLELHAGLTGYSQWQTSAHAGPDVTPAEAAARYQVHALGPIATLVLTGRRVQLSTRYMREFEAQSTFQGYTFQVTGAVNF